MAPSPEDSMGTLPVFGSRFLLLWFGCGLGVPKEPVLNSASGGAKRVEIET